DARPPRAGVRGGGLRGGLASRGGRRGVAERLGRVVHRGLCARLRRRSVRAGKWSDGPRRARRHGRPHGLCLATVADELKAAYLLAGGDRPKIDRALDRLRTRFAPDAVEVHAAADVSGEGVVAACNALGLFAGEGRLVVIGGVEAWKAPDAKAIAAYLKSPAPATTLALVAAELKKDA